MTISVVQSAQNVANATSVTVTLGAATTAGNCLVAVAGTVGATTAGTVSGITLGGSAGNWGSLASYGSGPDGYDIFWADPDCAGGQTSVVISTTGSSGTQTVTATVYELAGMPSALAALLDQQADNFPASGSASWTSDATPATTQASEIAIGTVGTASGRTITGPASPWVNEASQQGTELASMTGYQLLSATGTVTYSGTFSASSNYGAAVITLKAAAAPVYGLFPALFC